MKKVLLSFFLIIIALPYVQAQPEGVGQSGAMQLLINLWPKSSGFNGLDVASTDGIESNAVNPAGLAKANGTELVFAHTRWLIGSDVTGNAFGFAQKLGQGSALGITVNQLSVGQLERTTVDNPDGTLGTFSPSVLNLSLQYAKQFTEHIYVGITGRVITEATPEVNATGVAFDAGVQYRTGREDRLKIGIALRNVGPTLTFGGDGLGTRTQINPRNNFDNAVQIPAAEFELPVVLSLAFAYDFILDENNNHAISTLATFHSHSSFNNQIGVGVQYRYKKFFMLRGAYVIDEGIFNGEDNFDAHTGLAAGATLQAPFKTGKKTATGEDAFSLFALDISYRLSNPFSGTLTVGARIDL